jgi:transposase InsO family protein
MLRRGGAEPVAGITYAGMLAGWVHAVFLVDLFARGILGWQVADQLRSDLALDALEWRSGHAVTKLSMAWPTIPAAVSSTSIRYAERLEEAKAVRPDEKVYRSFLSVHSREGVPVAGSADTADMHRPIE